MPSDLPDHAQVPEGGMPSKNKRTIQVPDPEGGKKDLEQIEHTEESGATVEVYKG